MILKYVYYNTAGITVWFVVAILLGAPFAQVNRTLFFAVIMNLLTILPHLLLNLSFGDLLRVYHDQKFETVAESFLFYSTLGSIVGAWFGAFPILLDWNRPWQKWPITCVTGAIFGCLTAILYSYFVVHLRRKMRSKKGKIV